jgi:hypothetical protein
MSRNRMSGFFSGDMELSSFRWKRELGFGKFFN